MSKETLQPIARNLAALIGAGAIAYSVSGCENAAPSPSESYTEHTVVAGETLTSISESNLEDCDENYTGYDTQDSNRELMLYNEKSSSQVTANIEIINIPENFCELVHEN